jgi:hypothetical protein
MNTMFNFVALSTSTLFRKHADRHSLAVNSLVIYQLIHIHMNTNIKPNTVGLTLFIVMIVFMAIKFTVIYLVVNQ